MRSRLTVAIVLACTLVALPIAASGATEHGTHRLRGHAPKGFFGIAPQTVLDDVDTRYMTAGGIESVRIAVNWAAIQPTSTGAYQWEGPDQAVATAARAGLRILPFFYGTPHWLAHNWRTLPVANARQRAAWSAFLQAAVRRYGPGGEFWAEHSHEGVNYEPPISNPIPIREWQIWNEANFFYFAHPVSPGRYAKLVTISGRAIKAADPRAKVILTGLFGEPTATGTRGMRAAKFLNAVYRTRGIKSRFDGVALHPYAVDAETLAELAEEMRSVVLENHDRRTGLYITEMGWGSQNNFNEVAYEQGIQGQALQLWDSYSYLLANRRRLNLKSTYWFSWKDISGACNFCDSVGLFRGGPRFKPKPAWHTFVRLTGGRPRP